MIQKLGEAPERFIKRPGRDFTRPRTLTFETVISLLLTMSENSIGKVLIGRFHNKGKTPSASAFVQQRAKAVAIGAGGSVSPLHKLAAPGKNILRLSFAGGGWGLPEIRRIS